jgi:2-isopropylmalate synthase
MTGLPIQPNKAVVGKNAFSHASGIHQDGVIKESVTYEIMKPGDIGRKENKIVLGKLSGRHGFEAKISELGYRLNKEQVSMAFEVFKEKAEQKKKITNADLKTIVEQILHPNNKRTDF